MVDELVWTEPREVRRHLTAEHEKPRWWIPVLCVLATFLILLAPRFFERPTPNDHRLQWAIAVPGALAGAVIIVLGYPWFEGLFPVYFRVKAPWIIRSQGQTHQRRRLAEIVSYSQEGVGACHIFTLRLKTGERWMLGITAEDAPALEKLLRTRGSREPEG